MQNLKNNNVNIASKRNKAEWRAIATNRHTVLKQNDGIIIVKNKETILLKIEKLIRKKKFEWSDKSQRWINLATRDSKSRS